VDVILLSVYSKAVDVATVRVALPFFCVTVSVNVLPVC
jgi:hypothetical protein